MVIKCTEFAQGKADGQLKWFAVAVSDVGQSQLAHHI